jgi:uncharacterized membrane protein (UPF0182 family)
LRKSSGRKKSTFLTRGSLPEEKKTLFRLAEVFRKKKKYFSASSACRRIAVNSFFEVLLNVLPKQGDVHSSKLSVNTVTSEERSNLLPRHCEEERRSNPVFEQAGLLRSSQ